MLEGYFGDSGVTQKDRKRLLAVQAALEIAMASAAASVANVRTDKVEHDLKYVRQEIGYLADAIQSALEKK